MIFDPAQFLDAFCTWLSGASGLAYASTPRAIWRGKADESQATAVYTIVRVTGGASNWSGPQELRVQLRTIGLVHGDTEAQSSALWKCFFDATTGKPLRAVPAGSGYRLNAADPMQPPSYIGLDERERAEFVFNVALRAV